MPRRNLPFWGELLKMNVSVVDVEDRVKRAAFAVLSVAMLCSLLISPLAQAGTRTVSKPYVLGGDVAARCDDSGVNPNVGGACFAVLSSDASVEISISNDVPWTAGGFFRFHDTAGAPLTGGYFCGTKTEEIPSGAKDLVVYGTTATGPVACFKSVAPPGVAVSGDISVTFTSSN